MSPHPSWTPKLLPSPDSRWRAEGHLSSQACKSVMDTLTFLLMKKGSSAYPQEGLRRDGCHILTAPHRM